MTGSEKLEIGTRPVVGTRGPRLRRPIGLATSMICSLAAIALFFAAWFAVTRGDGEDRWVNPNALPSLQETFSEFRSLWFDRALTRNTYVTLRRVRSGSRWR